MIVARLKLNWAGKAYNAAARQAVLGAVYQTLSAAALEAQRRAPRDTGFMAATTVVTRPPSIKGDGVSGEFGNETADYTLWNEIGTSRMPARPFIRPAADLEFPNLPARIASRLPK
ncbi:MAG: hypothetical protein ACSLE9_08020 [Burkholderiaceae bacterium]